MIEIPLTSDPEQLFSIVLNDDTYDVRVTLNSRTGIWSISFSIGDVTLVDGVALLGGIDILDQYNFPIGNIFIVNLDKPDMDPEQDNLGIVARLFMLTDSEVSGG